MEIIRFEKLNDQNIGVLAPTSPRYSIIIVNYNGGPVVLNCLESVFQHSTNFELILVDNNSSDRSHLQASIRFPQIVLVSNEQNLGFAKANNVALSRAQGRWIVLLNPDTIVTSNWLENLAYCGVASEIGIVGPKLVRLDGRTIDSAGLFFNPKTGLSFDRGSGVIDRGQFDTAEVVPSLSFACVAIKREVVEDIGSLDEKMILYFDDIDYCFRARVAGWSVLFCPSSLVLHARGGVTRGSIGRLQRRAVAYRLRIMLKCYSARNVIRYGLARVLRDFVSAVAGIKNNDFDYFLGYLLSPIWNLMNPPIIERKLVQSTRKVSDESLFELR